MFFALEQISLQFVIQSRLFRFHIGTEHLRCGMLCCKLNFAERKICSNFLCLDLIFSLNTSQKIVALYCTETET